MTATADAEKEHQWMTVMEIARRFHCNWRTIYKHLYKDKNTGIVWVKFPFTRGLRARLDTIISYERKLQTNEEVKPKKNKGRLKVWG
jgi:hypothetical protein